MPKRPICEPAKCIPPGPQAIDPAVRRLLDELGKSGPDHPPAIHSGVRSRAILTTAQCRAAMTPPHSDEAHLLAYAQAKGWILQAQSNVDAAPLWAMTSRGRQALRHLKANATLAKTRSTPPRHLAAATGETAAAEPAINLAESPLAWLRSRRDASGEPMISSEQFGAGERLRSDFTLAGLTPRVTMSWSGIPGSGTSRGAPAGQDNMPTDNAVAARQRITHALVAVGAEHAGILIDVCGYMKGLEQIATAEGWPRRSAKLILQRALTALARHYGLLPFVPIERTLTERLRHWGMPDYRPALGQPSRPQRPATPDQPD